MSGAGPEAPISGRQVPPGVAVFGATGQLGRRVVRELLRCGRTVRAVSRTPGAARRQLPPEVELAGADLRDRASLIDACDGVSQIVSSANGFFERRREGSMQVDLAGHATLIEVARDAQVARFVFVSATTATPDSPIDYFRFKDATERRLLGSGLEYAIVRPTLFLETLLGLAQAALDEKSPFPIVGRGDRPLNVVAIDDVARYVALAVSDPRLRNRVLTVGGPENLSVTELLRRVAGTVSRAVSTRHAQRAVLRLLLPLVSTLNPVIGRQIRTGMLFDTTDLRFNASPVTDEFGIRPTPVDEVIAAFFAPLISCRRFG